MANLILSKYLLLEGEEMIESAWEDRCQIMNLTFVKRNEDIPEILDHNPFLKEFWEISGKQKDFYTPSLGCFPSWELNKKSKIDLCNLPLPRKEIVTEFGAEALNFIRTKGPKEIVFPDYTACWKAGNTKFANKEHPQRDGELPDDLGHNAFVYQRFKTDPMTEREVFLPSKPYKVNSTWFNSIYYQMCKNAPEIVAQQTMTDFIDKYLQSPMPCKSIDLKGFGLQFPREFLLEFNRLLRQEYDCDEMRSGVDICERLFANMKLFRPETGLYEDLPRGTGLGYYELGKSLCVRIMLGDCRIRAMFGDDIRVHQDDYEKARQRLEYFSLVINEKKSGKLAVTEDYFGGIRFQKLRTTAPAVDRLDHHKGNLAAVFNGGYHWYLKQLVHSIKIKENKMSVILFYEKLWGYEFFKGESLKHPINLGLLRCVPPHMGPQTFHAELATNVAPKSRYRGIFSEPLEETEKVSKSFSLLRQKEYNKFKKFDLYTYLSLFPRMEDNKVKPEHVIGALRQPSWQADRELYLFNAISIQRLHNLNQDDLVKYAYKFPRSKDPLRTEASGGYSPRYSLIPLLADPPPDAELVHLLEKFERANLLESKALNSREYTEYMEQQMDASMISHFISGPVLRVEDVNEPSKRLKEDLLDESTLDLKEFNYIESDDVEDLSAQILEESYSSEVEEEDLTIEFSLEGLDDLI
jgi:hypothetical protein